MTVTLELPPDVYSRLVALPEGERNSVVVAALRDGLTPSDADETAENQDVTAFRGAVTGPGRIENIDAFLNSLRDEWDDNNPSGIFSVSIGNP